MESWNIVSQFIQTVGFPAVCVLGMGWYVKYVTDQHHEEIQKLNDDHKKEMDEVTKALNNNTIAMQKLTDYIMFGKDERE